MAFRLADRVKETTQTTGTSTLTLAGPVKGFQAFSEALADNDVSTYAIVDRARGDHEVGVGTYSGGTLTRDSVLYSSNGDAKVSFGAGQKIVGITMVGRIEGGVVVVDGDDSTRTTKATAVQNAIDLASAVGLAHVRVPDDFTDYDASAVTFDNAVKMVREGGDPSVYDVVAYGAAEAAIDNVDAIQAAIDAAEANSGVVYVPAGTFLTSDLMVDTGNITIMGGGGDSVLKATARDHDTDTNWWVLRVTGSSGSLLENVVVSNLKIDGNKSAHSGTAINSSGEMVDMKYCRDSAVRDLYIVDAPADAVDWDNCENCVAAHNIAKDANFKANHISFDNERITVLGCIAIRCGKVGDAPAFDTSGSPVSNNCTYTGCIAYDCQRGFSIQGARHQVNGCKSIISQAEGLAVLSATDCAVSNFIAYQPSQETSPTQPGIFLNSSCTADGLTVIESGERGLEMGAAEVVVSNVRVIDPAQHGIVIQGGDQSLVNAFVRCAVGHSDPGVFVDQSDRTTLSNVRVEDAGTYGIRVVNSADTLASNVIVRGSGNHGIYINSDDVVVDGFQSINAGSDGVHVFTGIGGARLSNGRIEGASAQAVDLNENDCTLIAVTAETAAFVVRSGVTDTRFRDCRGTITDSGTRTRINGLGSESANAETPTAADWDVGDIVDFTDSGDGSGDGQYLLLSDGTTWAQVA